MVYVPGRSVDIVTNMPTVSRQMVDGLFSHRAHASTGAGTGAIDYRKAQLPRQVLEPLFLYLTQRPDYADRSVEELLHRHDRSELSLKAQIHQSGLYKVVEVMTECHRATTHPSGVLKEYALAISGAEIAAFLIRSAHRCLHSEIPDTQVVKEFGDRGPLYGRERLFAPLDLEGFEVVPDGNPLQSLVQRHRKTQRILPPGDSDEDLLPGGDHVVSFYRAADVPAEIA